MMRATHGTGFDVGEFEISGTGLTAVHAFFGSVGRMRPKTPLEGMLGPKLAGVAEAWSPTEPLCEEGEKERVMIREKKYAGVALVILLPSMQMKLETVCQYQRTFMITVALDAPLRHITTIKIPKIRLIFVMYTLSTAPRAPIT